MREMFITGVLVVPHLGVSVLALASPSLGTLKETRNTVTLSDINRCYPTYYQHHSLFSVDTERGVRHHARKESTVLATRVQHTLR